MTSVAVGQRLGVLAEHVIDGGALVPALGELGLAANDLAEGLDGGGALLVVHLLDADREESIDVTVAGAAPHLPQRALGESPHERVGVTQRRA